MIGYETRVTFPLGANLPDSAREELLEAQKTELFEKALEKIEPNKKYTIELRQEYFELPSSAIAGYKAAIAVEEQEA